MNSCPGRRKPVMPLAMSEAGFSVAARGTGVVLLESPVKAADAGITHGGGDLIHGKAALLQQQGGLFHAKLCDQMGVVHAGTHFHNAADLPFAVVEAGGNLGEGSRGGVVLNVLEEGGKFPFPV